MSSRYASSLFRRSAQWALRALLAVPLLASAGSAWAQGYPSGVSLGNPSYGGTGCPAGTAAASLSPDGKSLSILFDRFEVQAGGMSGNAIDRKSCNISIPVNVPNGYSVSVFKIDYRGFNALPVGANSQFNVEYFFAGTQGPRTERRFSGPVSSDFLISNALEAQAVSWSACGESVNLRASTSLMVQTNGYGEQSMSTLDSADINSAVIFQLQFRTCGPGPGPIGPGPGPIGPGPGPIGPGPGPIGPGPGPIGPGPGPIGPGPGTPIYGNCSIDQSYDYFGRPVYNVRDNYGQVIAQYSDYATAQRWLTLYQDMGKCRAQGSGGGYPVPPRNPYTGCTIATGRNAYGQAIYRVMTRSGAQLIATTDYQEALRVQATNPYCSR